MTPPEEFFHAADEVGLLVMAELPAAYTQYVLPHRDFLRQELEGVVLAYRNRPSLLSLAFGNEFNLTLARDRRRAEGVPRDGGRFLRARQDRCIPDGLLLSNDGYVMKPTDLVSHFGAGLPDLPMVKHEFGEYYCSLPDISLIDKFTGRPRPRVAARQEEVGRRERARGRNTRTYVRNSQRLQQLGRKYPDRARAAPAGRHRAITTG